MNIKFRPTEIEFSICAYEIQLQFRPREIRYISRQWAQLVFIDDTARSVPTSAIGRLITHRNTFDLDAETSLLYSSTLKLGYQFRTNREASSLTMLLPSLF